jgi:hypothetical protein
MTNYSKAERAAELHGLKRLGMQEIRGTHYRRCADFINVRFKKQIGL